MRIERIDYSLPVATLTNEDLENIYSNWTASKIFKKTGINIRHCVKEERISDLACEASEKLFNHGGIDRQRVDFLLLCTQSPDYFLPTTACIVQNRLGLNKKIGALDFNLGCSGFVYGLALAKGLIQSGSARNVLLLTAEMYSRYIHPMDKSARTIFGDGAAATFISGDRNSKEKIGEFFFGTDGRGAENLIVPAGGTALPKSSKTNIETVDDSGSIRTSENLFMNGPEIFNFTLEEIPGAVKETLVKNNLSLSDINLFVFHQANRFMLEALRDKIGIPEDRFYINMAEKGNTVSASIPIALKDAVDERRLKQGDKVLIAGFGVGYSWSSCVLNW